MGMQNNPCQRSALIQLILINCTRVQLNETLPLECFIILIMRCVTHEYYIRASWVVGRAFGE